MNLWGCVRIWQRQWGVVIGRSPVDSGHVRVVVTLARGGREVVQTIELTLVEHDAVCSGVLLDSGDLSRTGDWCDVVALGEQPGQRDLRRGGSGLGGDGLNLIDDAQVALEVLTGEPGLVLRQSSSGMS